MVVIKPRDSGIRQLFSGTVQSPAQSAYRFCIGIIKTVHSGDHDLICTEIPCFGNDRIDIPLYGTQILVYGDYGQPGLFHQVFPVQFTTFSGGHPSCFGQHPDQKRCRADHKSVQFNSVISGLFDRLQGGLRLLFSSCNGS